MAKTEDSPQLEHLFQRGGVAMEMFDEQIETTVATDGTVTVKLVSDEETIRDIEFAELMVEFADNEHIGLLRDALARFSTVLSHQRKRVRPLHRRKAPGERDGAFEHSAVGFSVMRQRPAFLLAAVPAPARALVLAAAGFF